MKIVLIILSIFMVVFLVEAVSFFKTHNSWSGSPLTIYDSELGWRNKPNCNIYKDSWGYISTNSLGFRGNELVTRKPTIAVMGDSVVFGSGVDNDHTMTCVANTETNFKYQFVNMGVPGYSTYQSWLHLKNNIDKLGNLKAVILVICTANDLNEFRTNYSYAAKPMICNRGVVPVNNKLNIFNKSFILSLLRKSKLTKSNMENIIISCGAEKYTAYETLDVYIKLLKDIDRYLMSRDIEFCVILSPSKGFFRGKKDDYGKFKYIAVSAGVKCVDGGSVMRLNYGNELDVLYKDYTHFNREGNLAMGRMLIKLVEILERG